MDEERIWTAEELEQLSPDERHRVVNEGVITDLAQVPPEFLKRVRRRGRELLEQRGLLDQQRGS
jgi:phosphoribosylaminoimidazole-succinocarboxamide synthase